MPARDAAVGRGGARASALASSSCLRITVRLLRCVCVCVQGQTTRESERREARINRIQLEVDSGKSVHNLHPLYSLVDLNRAGVGLLEIVTEPDFRSADEVSAFLKRLTLLLRMLGTSDSNLEDGSIR